MLTFHHMESQITELPPYTLRVSERAKRISLRFTVEKGLELVIPSSRYERKAIEFLRSQHAWIKKKQAQFVRTDLSTELKLPQKIILPAINQIWHVIYNESHQVAMTVLEEAKTLLIRTPADNFKSARVLLLNFLKDLAFLELKPRLDELSELSGLSYRSVNFASHKTQWGSCSRITKINLNIQLLFLTKALVDYVMVHELCHTRYFDHSRRFWSLVAEFIPDYQEQRKQLRKGKNDVPLWVCCEPPLLADN